MKRRLLLLLLLLTAGMAWAQSSPYERKASETDKPAVFGYMISDFFHQRYREGPGPLWRTVGWVLAVDLVLLADLLRRPGLAPVKRLAVLWVALWLSNQALPRWYESTFLPPAEYRTLPDVLLDVLGEGRTMLARIMWFKMDLFHEVLDDQGVENSQQVQVMPLLRMATYLDPHLDDAYDVMAWDLFRGHGRTDDALALLDEGLRYNPNSHLLGYRRALILFRTGQYAQAAAAAETLLARTSDDFSRVELLRLLYHCYDELKDDRGVERVLTEMLVLRPGEEIAVKGLAKLRQRR